MLKREMSAFGGLLITLSCLSPSIGVFIVGNDVIHQVGSGAFACFVAAVLLGIAMSAIYAELASAFPNTGAEYTIASGVIGPSVGFGLLATNLAGYCIALGTSGLGVADYLRPVFPALPQIPTAMAVIVVVCLVAVLSVTVNAVITGLFLGVELMTLLATAVLGFSHAQGGASALLAHPVVADAAHRMHPVSGIMLGVAASSAIYAFNGYGSAVNLGEEIRQARAKVGAVVYWALAIAAVTELLPLAAVIVGVPDFPALSASASPMTDFFRELGGPGLSRLLSLAVAAAIFNTMIAVALVGGRQIYAAARDRCWPEAVSARLDRVHPRFNSPWVATIVLGAAALLCCMVPTHLLLIVLGDGNVGLYAALAISVIVGRRNGSTQESLWRAPWHPLAPAVVLVALAGVVWANLLDAETGRPGLVAEVVVFCAGAGYFATRRRSGEWRLGVVEE